MAQKKKPHLSASSRGDTSKKKRREKGKQKQPKTPQQRVMVMGPTGKKRMIWRPWT